MNTLRSLSLCLLVATAFPAAAEVFTCTPEWEKAVPMNLRIQEGRLYTEWPGTPEPLIDQGPITTNGSMMVANLEKPLLPDGQGRVRSTWQINRATGQYSASTSVTSPYMKQPVDMSTKGVCTGLVQTAPAPTVPASPVVPAPTRTTALPGITR